MHLMKMLLFVIADCVDIQFIKIDEIPDTYYVLCALYTFSSICQQLDYT